MKTTKKAALAAASSALLLGLTVAQTVNADTYTVQNGDSFFGIASQYGVDQYQIPKKKKTHPLALPSSGLLVRLVSLNIKSELKMA